MKTKTTTIKSNMVMFMALLVLPIFVLAQSKPELNQSKEIITDQPATSKVMGNERVEVETGIVRAVYSPNFAVANDEPKEMAKQYLQAKALPLLLKSNIDDLEHERTMETPGGFKVQFKQKAAGYPVYGSDLKVSINRNNKVVFVTNSYKPIGKLQTDINTSAEAAILTSKNHIGITGKVRFEKVETVVYAINTLVSVIAYKVNLVPSEDHFGDWEIIINAGTGIVLRAEDKACYYYPEGDEVQVDGSGWVFDPDPITNAQTTYGASQFADNNDADSDSLTAQLKTVTLRGLQFNFGTGMYWLQGPYAAIVDVEEPFTGYYEQASSDFYYTRSNEAFEAVNAYYHLDKSMRYINETLGFNVMPHQYEGGVQFDPHGLNGGNNAYYNGSTGQIAFGSPASSVDVAEDHAIIIHELGHGLHHWITNNSLSQVDGLSEGLSDYWAQSYTRSLGLYEPNDEAYDYFGVWGNMPNWGPPYLRITNFDGHYPEALNGEVHHDGQLWSSSLMSIYDLIGREATDMDCWEGISMLNSISSQVDAAYAFIQADGDLYNGAHMEHIYKIFYERGYFADPVFPGFTADQPNGEGPRDVIFTDYSTAYLTQIVSWKWDFNNDGVIDSYDQNPTHTFTEVGAYTISLTVSDGTNTETLVKKNYITVDGGFFVFETYENHQDFSGTFIRDFLEARGYDVVYSNYFPGSFAGFDAVFLSFGNASGTTDEVPLLTYGQSLVIQEYLENGGKVYFEANILAGITYYVWDNAAQLLNLFGVASVELGQVNPISSLEGQADTWAEGMLFNESNQQFNAFIDKITPVSSAYIPFYEDDYGNVSVYNEGEYGQKTFYFDYSLAELVDVDPHSSRYNILVKLLEFFGYPEGDGYVVANFKADQTEVEADIDVQFTDWSLVDEGYNITGWAWDFDEDGEIDSYDQNPVWAYSYGGIYDVKLVVVGDEDSDTLVKEDYISVRSGFLVYEGHKNENGYSGAFIRDYLEDNWVSDEVSYTNNFPSSLEGYDYVFLSFGSRGWRKTALTDSMTNAIIDYCTAGGRIYIEGGDVMNSFSDKELFGLLDVDDGENNAFDKLLGQFVAITNGMQFDSTNQFSHRSIDIYTILENNPNAIVAFRDMDYGRVAVQYDGTGGLGHKTFCMSYAMADLVDGEGINTRNELLERILIFFDVLWVGTEESEIVAKGNFHVFPNPARDHVSLRLNLEEGSNLQFELFDLSGRQVSTINNTLPSGTHQFDFDIADLPSGIYYFRCQSNTFSETIKWVKVE